MNILGFEIKSKEEREQEEREYLHRIFPGGTAQKAAVEQQLKERLPREDKKAVMLYYILVKDAMTAGNGMSFEEAVEIRTPDTTVRSRMLYPAELLTHAAV